MRFGSNGPGSGTWSNAGDDLGCRHLARIARRIWSLAEPSASRIVVPVNDMVTGSTPG
ncbi:hypothetical protein [Actinomadura xylanilytica]|uniref:hypothetical protein n=1 Tax=Actinomadura xylanilytica TaxID=887459 RepID=UPI00255AE414|nr:hypothetical protein [Actinomadura xylanilytica]MDL4776597.1 hypothetical protein [Actinomadura xylanilytica]